MRFKRHIRKDEVGVVGKIPGDRGGCEMVNGFLLFQAIYKIDICEKEEREGMEGQGGEKITGGEGKEGGRRGYLTQRQ